MTRRRFSRILASLAALPLLPLRAVARNEEAFQAAASEDVLRALFADKPLLESEDITLKAPEIAEDGSIVPVTVSADMEGVRSITLLVDSNPNPLSARFHFMPGAVPEFKTRIKMGETSDIRAVAETDEALYVTTRNIKVTLGGCGG